MLGLVVGEVAAGCGFHSPAAATADGDAGNDSGTDGNGGCSFATLVDTCQLSFEADLIVNGPARYDTDTHVLMIGSTATPFAVKTVHLGSDQIDVISAHDVHLGMSATFRATGSHGLAIIASNNFLIDGDAEIDVSKGGAGARTSCPGGAAKGQNNSNGAGGGGGGGFGDAGGNGGDGNHDGPPGQGGSQGMAEPSFPIGFHGGCPGADGGGGGGGAPGGDGGQGGGALYLVAARSMVFTSSGPLDAGGDGGRGGGHSGNNGDAGGGGGGSGGLLILEAPQIQASGATIAANGGSGGQGSDRNNSGGDGAAGGLSTDRAPGGSGGSVTGSAGGDGGSGAGSAGRSVTANADGGGGGGGGAAGFIRIYAPHPVFLAVSPSPSPG